MVIARDLLPHEGPTWKTLLPNDVQYDRTPSVGKYPGRVRQTRPLTAKNGGGGRRGKGGENEKPRAPDASLGRTRWTSRRGREKRRRKSRDEELSFSLVRPKCSATLIESHPNSQQVRNFGPWRGRGAHYDPDRRIKRQQESSNFCEAESRSLRAARDSVSTFIAL